MTAGTLMIKAKAVPKTFAWVRQLGVPLSRLATVFGVLGLVLGLLMVIGAVQIYIGELGRVRAWSIVVVVLSLLSLLMFGEWFTVGSVLALVGGVLGLVWSLPSKQRLQH